MIQLTRLNSRLITINSDLIEMIDETPDTIVTLTTGRKILVEESAAQILEKVTAFRSRCREFCGVSGEIRLNSAGTAAESEDSL